MPFSLVCCWMKFSTKFSSGDKVFVIIKGTQQKIVDCPTCEGSCFVIIGKEKFNCPKCYGRGSLCETIPMRWRLYEEFGFTVGQIRIEYTNSKGIPDSMFSNYSKQRWYKEQYMLTQTGVGSGSIWDADCLFASKERAIEECKKRNEEEGIA